MASGFAVKLSHRPAALRDVPLLARLNRQLVEDEGARTRLTLDGLETRMRGWLRGEYAATLFELGDEPVAYALYRKFDGGTHLRQFFVLRHARRRGIGRQAIELLLERVLASEATIELGVLAHNRPALGFWKAVGFAEYVITLEKLRRPLPTSRQALIALGSNLGDSRATALAAIDRLSALPLRRSSLWESAPVDCSPGSPPFVNAAVALEPAADETPESLLKKLQALEKEFGRRPKKVLNEPRRLDLDLIAFGREVRSTRALTLPHPRAHLRRFVLAPLNELVPDFVLPGHRRTIRAHLKAQGASGAVRRVR